MSSKTSPILSLGLAALAAGAVAFGIHRLGEGSKVPTAVAPTAQPAKAKWAATAQGRVEPRTGEVKLSAHSPGRIEDVLVAVNDKIAAGDLLVRTEDVDPLAKILAADAEAGVRKRERDTETGVPRLAQDRRSAEDKLNATERAVAAARLALDRLQIARHAAPASVTAEQISAARNALDDALRRLAPDREALRQAQIASGVPLPTRLEAGLTASRADLSLAEAALERTRVRAPFDGVVLQVLARVGETASPSPEQPLLVVGDLSQLKVRAEVEERDVAKVAVDQGVLLKTDAYPDKEFAGKVASIAQSMRPPRLAQRGPRRPNDLDMLEVVIDVAPGSPLLPGMRVDVFFKIEPPKSEPPRAETPRAETPAARSAAPAPTPPSPTAAVPAAAASQAPAAADAARPAAN